MSGWYLAISLAMTWPLATSLTRRLPHDLGDPLLNCWILQWDLDHFLRILGGDWRALARFFDGNLFYPEPLVLAYSEHLIAPALQALPVYAATGNILLCYNALFLSTYVLSGLGAFLLVRGLTGSARAAFVAGLFYAFTPYRLAQLGHLQVLSSQWMPFALYGLQRWIDSGRARPLVGAVAALTLQNLSCGYYLLYFPPFAAAYAAWELARRGRLRDARAWLQLAAAAAAVAALTLPTLIPYLQLRQQHGFGPRPLRELRWFSADATSYLAGSDRLWLWPNGFSQQLSSEAVLFPGFTPLVLAVLAVACLLVALRRRVLGEKALRGWRLAAAIPISFLALAAADLTRFELFAGRHIGRVRATWPWLSDVRRGIAIGIGCVLALVALSPRVRAAARLSTRSGRMFFATAFCAAVWMSFGPQVRTRQRALTGPTFYAWLYEHVPGFDGLRVPGRYGMLAMLFLAVVAGYGARALAGGALAADRQRQGGRWRNWRLALLAVAGAFFLLESTGAPLKLVALEWARKDGRPGTVSVSDMDPLYAYIREMPAGTVVAEFPFGDLPQGETRAVFLSTRHGHPILNGYSGGFPASYNRRQELLQNPVDVGEAAWYALRDSGATCVVVHEWAFDGNDGAIFSRWLEQHGALPLARFRSDRIYTLAR